MAFDKEKWDQKFKYQEYKPSDAVLKAQEQLQSNLAQKPGAYQSSWQNQLNDTMNQILNRKAFNYDLNGDALYQQYKDQYVNQGRMAMMDTMGQATALTGGYGNSYAQNAGQQAYQGYLQQLNDRIPELYNMALSRYQMEGNDLAQRYGMLSDRENQDYGRYQDALAAWQADRNYASSRYDTERNLDLNQYNLNRDYGYNQWVNDRNYAYQQEQDRIAQEQWERQFAAAQAAKRSSGGGGGGILTGAPDDDNDGNKGKELPINIKSVNALGYGPISGAVLQSLVSNGDVYMKEINGQRYAAKAPDVKTPSNPVQLALASLANTKKK